MWYKLENSGRFKRLKDDPDSGNVEKQPYKINMWTNKHTLNKVHDLAFLCLIEGKVLKTGAQRPSRRHHRASSLMLNIIFIWSLFPENPYVVQSATNWTFVEANFESMRYINLGHFPTKQTPYTTNFRQNNAVTQSSQVLSILQ